MGVGPSTPNIRCMNTAHLVKGLPRLVSVRDTAQLDSENKNCDRIFSLESSTMTSVTKLPGVNIEKAGETKSSGAIRATKASGNGSPAKRPTAFINLPRSTALSVRYDGLSAHKTIGARKMEAQAQDAYVSKGSNVRMMSQAQVAEKDKSKLSPYPILQTTHSAPKDSHVPESSKEAAGETNEKNVCSEAIKAVGESQAEKVQQIDADETSKKQAEPGENLENGVSQQKNKSKKTAEEIEEKFQAGLQKIQTKCDLLATVNPRDLEKEGEPYTHDFRQCVLVFANSYFYFKTGEVAFSEIIRYRTCVSEYLCQSHVLGTILKTLADGLKRRDYFDEAGEVLKDYWFPTKNMLNTLLNNSDLIDSIKFSITEHTEMIPQLMAVLENYREPHMNKTLTEEQEKLLRICLGILHNCGALEENVSRLRDFNIIPLLLTYVDSPQPTIRLSSIATLADLVNESEAELLSTHPKSFTFIIHKVERALKVESHRDAGWSVEELLRAVRQLARNDANKAILVDKGCLPVLLASFQKGNDDELQEALDCLWILSFDDSNKPKIMAEPGLVQAVCDKYRAGSGRAGHTCHGILWSLREHLQASPDFQDIAGEIMTLKSQATPKVENKVVVEDVSDMSAGTQFQEVADGSPGTDSDLQRHVMISYQWANQEVIKRICSELRTHGIPVWIDIDYMGGSTLQAMAQAVEDSFAVIIAMTQKYKDSPNTRAEAEYTFQQRKPIVPLIMQNGYSPDGWLGLILGSKLYYDFSGKYSFESRMDGLLKAILTVAKKGAGDAMDGAEQPLVATKAGAVTLTSPSVLAPPVPVGHVPGMSRPIAKGLDEQVVRNWSREDVSKWLAKFQLEGSDLKDLSGEEIVFMHNLKYEAPEFFYNCLDKKLSITSVMDLAKASKAFGNLSSHT